MARLSRPGQSAWRIALGIAVAAAALAFTLYSIRGGAAATPYETLTTPEGVVINVYSSRVHAADVYSKLLANGLQSWVGLAQVDVVDSGITMSSVGGGTSTSTSGAVSYFASPALMQINSSDYLAHPDFTIGHEYGHVWSNYYKWTYWQDSYAAYLSARGLTGNPKLDSGGCWYVDEIIADDYRQLFAAPETTPGVVIATCNPYLPSATSVAGLRDFLGVTWTNGHPPPGYGSVNSTPTPAATSVPPTPTPTPSAVSPKSTSTPAPTTSTPTRTAVPPTSTPTRTPVAPTATAIPPSATATPGALAASVTLTFPKGWNSFVAPVSGSTSRAVYASSGKKAVALFRVTVGVMYWVKGPATLTITPP